MIITPLEARHWADVKRIYEEGIATGYATLETQSPDWEKWNSEHLEHSRLVAVDDDQVLGWAALTPVSGRCVYSGVAELSVYIAAEARGRGIGQKLLEELIRQSETRQIWTLQAGIMAENKASIRLHQKSGFRIVGYREKIAKLDNTWRNIYLLERRSTIAGTD